MNFRTPIWMRICWEGEGAGAGGADGAGAGAGAGAAGGRPAGGEDGGGAPAGGGAPQSIFAQMSGLFDADEERADFEKWSTRYTDDKSRAKALLEMRKGFDQRVKIPGENDKPEDVDKFWQRLGKPPTAKDYKFEFNRQLGDDEVARVEAAKEFAHKHNFTQGQFEKMLELNETLTAKDLEAANARLDSYQEEVVTKLKQEWGPDFDANLEYARSAGIQFAGDEKSWKEFVNTPIVGGMRIGDHPLFMQVMAKVGRAYAEDERATQFHESGEAASIKAQIAAIEKEAMDKNESTADEYWHKKLDPLYKKLYPTKRVANPGQGGLYNRG